MDLINRNQLSVFNFSFRVTALVDSSSVYSVDDADSVAADYCVSELKVEKGKGVLYGNPSQS